MRRWQWALLAASALIAATWANGAGSWCFMAAAGIIGFAVGWAAAHRVTR